MGGLLGILERKDEKRKSRHDFLRNHLKKEGEKTMKKRVCYVAFIFFFFGLSILLGYTGNP
jgi:hypothetical protein